MTASQTLSELLGFVVLLLCVAPTAAYTYDVLAFEQAVLFYAALVTYYTIVNRCDRV